MQRLQLIKTHLQPNEVFNYNQTKAQSDDDVVVVGYARTALAKGKRGGFKDTPCDHMLHAVFEDVVKKTKVNVNDIGDIRIGNNLQAGAGSITARMAQLRANIPHTTPIHAINRLCSSGLQAVATIAN